MSVKELRLKTAYDVLIIKQSPNENTVELYANGQQIILNRSQAHMLKLWLEEHLK